MIRASFLKADRQYCGFSVSGHAGFGPYGEDIACASVTSAVQLTVNAVTEVLHLPAAVEVLEDMVRMELPEGSRPAAQPFVEALKLHLSLLAEEFEDAISVIEESYV